MFKKVLYLLLAAIAVALLYSSIKREMALKKYLYLKDSQIVSMERQKMIVVEAKGDPKIVAMKAFGQLFKTYFRLKNNRIQFSAPRARWVTESGMDMKNEWKGYYALPVAESVDTVPQINGADLLTRIEYWDYGQVAEILYIGPYAEETATIEKLHKFIDESGYKISGLHEEEYIKGPGMFLKGNPQKYMTIIRYQIAKK